MRPIVFADPDVLHAREVVVEDRAGVLQIRPLLLDFSLLLLRADEAVERLRDDEGVPTGYAIRDRWGWGLRGLKEWTDIDLAFRLKAGPRHVILR